LAHQGFQPNPAAHLFPLSPPSSACTGPLRVPPRAATDRWDPLVISFLAPHTHRTSVPATRASTTALLAHTPRRPPWLIWRVPPPCASPFPKNPSPWGLQRHRRNPSAPPPSILFSPSLRRPQVASELCVRITRPWLSLVFILVPCFVRGSSPELPHHVASPRRIAHRHHCASVNPDVLDEFDESQASSQA
jgi:hypothetical protein